MPALPTLNVTDAQLARVQAAFKDAGPGTPAQNYKAWLRQAVVDKVFQAEADAITVQAERDIAAKRKNIEDDLSTTA